MKVLFFIFLSILIIKPTFAQSLASPATGSSANFSSLATRQYLSGKSEESLALYQKAIAKAESEYGKNSRAVGDLYYQLGVRAFWLSKFNLAERSFKKAVEINPNSEAAQLMLISLLRFRNRDIEAYGHIQQALKKHPDSTSLRKDMVIFLQDKDPVRATQQAYIANCVQNGVADKISTLKEDAAASNQDIAPELKNLDKDKKGKSENNKFDKLDKNNTQGKRGVTKKNSASPDSLTNKKDSAISDDLTNKKTAAKSNNLATKKTKLPQNQISKPNAESQATSKAIYEPIKNAATAEVKPKKATHSHKKSGKNKMPAGLVPPPPPDTLGFPASMPTGMRAKAGSIKLEKGIRTKQSAPPDAAPQKPAVDRSSAESDPDFLIEWASVKKKHPQSNAQTK